MIAWAANHLFVALCLIAAGAAITVRMCGHLSRNVFGDIEDYLLAHSSVSVWLWVAGCILISLVTATLAVLFVCAILLS